jgi:lipopolysaccharide transport system permease protein
MMIAVIRVVAMDFATIVDEGMKLLMFLTPVVYTAKVEVSWLREIIVWNPLTYLIGFSRELLTRGTLYEPGMYLICTGVSLAIFVLALVFFRNTAKRALERLTIT